MTLEDQIKKLNPEQLKAIMKAIDTPISTGVHSYHDKRFKKKHLRIGVIGDTHIGSKYFDQKALEIFVGVCEKENVDFYIQTGDITDGMYNNRPGHIYELTHLGYDAQLKAVTKSFPNTGKKTFFITGNHDETHIKNAGADIGFAIEKARSDMIYLGPREADLFLGEKEKTRLKLFHPGGGTCFDDQTEILTENGWRLFKDLQAQDKVATLNVKENCFEWQEPTKYTDELFDGELLHFTARTFDLLVTPNHRFLVRRYNLAIDYSRKKELDFPQKSHKRVSKEWVVKTAEELRDAKRQEWQMKRGDVLWKGNSIPVIKIPPRSPKKFASTPIKHIGEISIEDAAELIAWYVTEGCINRKGTQLSISQSARVNPKSHEEIVHLLNRIGFSPKPRGRDLKDITVCSVELNDWLLNECGSGSRNKYLPRWLKDQPVDVLQIVFETLISGDGWVNGRGFGYKSISKRLRHDFSEVALKLGYAVTEHLDSVSVSRIQVYPTINSKPRAVKYSGRVYCVSVPNDTVLVRRKGRAIWSKNSYAISYKPQKIIESFEGGKKPEILVIGHFHKIESLFYRGVNCIQAGTFQSQSEFMRVHALAAHKAGTILDVDMINDGTVTSFKTMVVPFYE